MSHLCCETLRKWKAIFILKQISLTHSHVLPQQGTIPAPLTCWYPDSPTGAKKRGVLPSLGLLAAALQEQRGFGRAMWSPFPLKARQHPCLCLLSCFEQMPSVFTEGLCAWHGAWDIASSAMGMLFRFCCRGVGKAGERGLERVFCSWWSRVLALPRLLPQGSGGFESLPQCPAWALGRAEQPWAALRRWAQDREARAVPVLGHLLRGDGAERVPSSAPEKSPLWKLATGREGVEEAAHVFLTREDAWKRWTDDSSHFCLLEAQTSYRAHTGCQQANHRFSLRKFKCQSTSCWQELRVSFFLARGSSRSEQSSPCWPLAWTCSAC